MMPSSVDPNWYESYWYGTQRRRKGWRRLWAVFRWALSRPDSSPVQADKPSLLPASRVAPKGSSLASIGDRHG
jgi:hypothetical protein